MSRYVVSATSIKGASREVSTMAEARAQARRWRANGVKGPIVVYASKAGTRGMGTRKAI